MFVSKLEDVHESMRDKFVEHEKDGVSGFIDVEEKKAIDMLFHIKEEKKKYQTNIESLNSELTSFKESEAQKIEQARADALEQAKNKGEVADIEKLYEERIADAEKRAAELARAEVTKEYEQKSLKQAADMELTEIVAGLKPKDDFSARLIRDHLQARRTIEDGKIIYFNEDGGASSLDKNGLLAELRDSGKFNALSSYEPIVKGGGNLKGGDGSGAPSSQPKLSTKTQGYLANLK